MIKKKNAYIIYSQLYLLYKETKRDLFDKFFLSLSNLSDDDSI